MVAKRTTRNLSALGMVALAAAIVGLSRFAAADSGGLQSLLAKGVPTVFAFQALSPCPGVTCPSGVGHCSKWAWTAPVLLNIGGVLTNSQTVGCMTSDDTTAVSNGTLTCENVSGTTTITKPSGNNITAAMGGQLCFDVQTSTTVFGSFHTGYIITGGTGSLSSSQGTGDFNLGFTEKTSGFTGVPVDMNGNYMP